MSAFSKVNTPNVQASSSTQRLGIDLDKALRAISQVGGSDLHLTVGATPKIRVNGKLKSLSSTVIESGFLTEALEGILSESQKKRFAEENELDFSYEIPDVGRFRCNYFRGMGNPGAVFRFLSNDIKNLEDLKMPKSLDSLAEFPRGLVLVTGPTGSGKSTTLAAVLDKINSERPGSIITIEDPIEYVHKHKRSNVNQREVGEDTKSFSIALKHALRQDPDVILVGELRDLETISIALTAAETGHLVFATLHTQDTAQAIDRIIDVFPGDQQAQIRSQLASTLQAVVCQALVPTLDGKGRVAATEVMFMTPAISNLIREGKGHQIYSTLQSSRGDGMHTMDQSLAELVNDRRISYDEGLSRAIKQNSFNELVKGNSLEDF